MKRKYLIIIHFIMSLMLLTSCRGDFFLNLTSIFEDKDIIMANAYIDNFCNGIKERDEKAIKKEFSDNACMDADDIDAHIKELFAFVKGELLSWEWDEDPVVENYVDEGKRYKQEMFWIRLKTSEEVYSIFFSCYPIEEINHKNKGIYAILVLEERDENTLVGSINEWDEEM